jgi:hypothetical protein
MLKLGKLAPQLLVAIFFASCSHGLSLAFKFCILPSGRIGYENESVAHGRGRNRYRSTRFREKEQLSTSKWRRELQRTRCDTVGKEGSPDRHRRPDLLPYKARNRQGHAETSTRGLSFFPIYNPIHNLCCLFGPARMQIGLPVVMKAFSGTLAIGVIYWADGFGTRIINCSSPASRIPRFPASVGCFWISNAPSRLQQIFGD